MTNISWDAFRGCTDISEITVAEGNPIYAGIGNALVVKETKTLYLGCKNTVIPTDGSITIIGDDSFWECLGLNRIVIPDCVTEIRNGAFFQCKFLEEVVIGNGVTSIGWSAFDGCEYLEELVIPSSVTTIGWYAFSGCKSLTSLTIPASVTELGGMLFYDCTLSIYCEAASQPATWEADWNVTGLPVEWGYTKK